MQIINEVKVDGKWVRMETLPPDVVSKIIEETIMRAGRLVGFEVTKKSHKEG